MTVRSKQCARCGVVKHTSCFGRVGSGGKAAECTECRSERKRDFLRRRGPEYAEWNKTYQRNWSLKRNYGITLEEYEQLFAAQGGQCAICGAPSSDGGRNLAVDHCHETGTIRGLLCRACNRGLGCLQESVDLLRKATQYLEATKAAVRPYKGA